MERLLLRIIPQTLIQSRTQDVGYYTHCIPNLSKSLRLRVTIELLGIYFLLEDVTVSTLTYTMAALGENQRTNGLVRAAAAS